MYTYKRRLHDVRYQANKTADNFFTKKKTLLRIPPTALRTNMD